MSDAKLTLIFRQKLQDQITRMGEQNGLKQKGGFVSDVFLQELFASEDVELWLAHNCPKKSSKELGEYIRKRARKLFGILILIEHAEMIPELQDQQPEVNDASLFDIPGGDQYRPYCRQAKLEDIPALRDVAEAFYEMQWIFPAKLSATVHQEFDPKLFIFPFQENPRHIRTGGNGAVHRVQIDKEFLQFAENTKVSLKVLKPSVEKLILIRIRSSTKR
jgi:hypothetical protein